MTKHLLKYTRPVSETYILMLKLDASLVSYVYESVHVIENLCETPE